MTAPALTGDPDPPAAPALVVSHERSGTHFLMNTLALNFGYQPYVDLDERPGFDPHSTPQLLNFLLGTAWPPRTVLKSHHQAEVLLPVLPWLADLYRVFYVVRDPRDALLSLWRFVASSPAGEGPCTATVGDFLRAAPAGRLLRYQRRAAATMVERWRLHVEGWSDAADRLGGRLHVVRYDDLDQTFAPTVARLAAALRPAAAPSLAPTPPGPPEPPLRPSKVLDVIHPGAGGSGAHRALFTAADQALVREQAGQAMRRWGWEPDS